MSEHEPLSDVNFARRAVYQQAFAYRRKADLRKVDFARIDAESEQEPQIFDPSRALGAISTYRYKAYSAPYVDFARYSASGKSNLRPRFAAWQEKARELILTSLPIDLSEPLTFSHPPVLKDYLKTLGLPYLFGIPLNPRVAEAAQFAQQESSKPDVCVGTLSHAFYHSLTSVPCPRSC